MHVPAVAYLAAVIVLPVYWLLPLALLLTLVRLEAARGGPRWWLHLVLNAAFIAWSIYSVEVLDEDPHGPNSPFVTIPRLLLVAVFYLVLLPQVVDALPRFIDRFRYALAMANLLVFVVLGNGLLHAIGAL
jgi:hypothetical protein